MVQAILPHGEQQGFLELCLVDSPVESLPWAAVAEGEGSPASLEEFQEGLFHVQDLSAQLACSLLEARRIQVAKAIAVSKLHARPLRLNHGHDQCV